METLLGAHGKQGFISHSCFNIGCIHLLCEGFSVLMEQ